MIPEQRLRISAGRFGSSEEMESPMGRPRKNPVKQVTWNGEECDAIESTVKPQGTGGGVYVPADWIGEQVLVIRLE